MFKKYLPIAVILCLVLVLPAYGGVIATMGNYNSSGNYDIEVDSDHYISSYGGIKTKYELVTTNNTLVATETGTTYVVRHASAVTTNTVTFTLPTAVAGLEFTIISADDETIYIDPQSTDTIIHLATMTAGDKLTSAGATSNSITLISPVANYWAVKAQSGSWTDGN